MSLHLFKRHQRKQWRHRPKVKPRGLKRVEAEDMLAMQQDGKMDRKE